MIPIERMIGTATDVTVLIVCCVAFSRAFWASSSAFACAFAACSAAFAAALSPAVDSVSAGAGCVAAVLLDNIS